MQGDSLEPSLVLHPAWHVGHDVIARKRESRRELPCQAVLDSLATPAQAAKTPQSLGTQRRSALQMLIPPKIQVVRDFQAVFLPDGTFYHAIVGLGNGSYCTSRQQAGH
jgi:hypothetical protein